MLGDVYKRHDISGPKSTGGTTAFSSATDTVEVTVNSINGAPVLTSAGDSLLTGSGTTFTARTGFTEIREDDTTSAGDAVSTLLSSASATDEELPGGVTGVAVTSVTTTNGNWQFSTDGGTTFTSFAVTDETNSLLLDGANPSHKVRFVPNLDFNGDVAIKYRAWDGSDNTPVGNPANTTNTGGTTAFSSGEVTKTITVTPVNDEPSQTLRSVPAVDEDVAQQSVGSFVTSKSKGGGSDENSQTLSFALSNTCLLYTSDAADE